MAIEITKEAYENKFGHPPVLGNVDNPVTNSMVQKQSFGQDMMSDIKQTGTKIGQGFNNTFGQGGTVSKALGASMNGEQGIARGFGQAVGAAAGGVSGMIGSGLKGVVKTVLPQSTEDVLKSGIQKVAQPVMENPNVKDFISKYKSLDEKTKRDVNAFLGISSLALDLTGVGVATKAGIQGGKMALKGVETVAEGVKPAISTAGRALKATGEGAYGLTVIPKKATTQMIQSYNASKPSLFSRVKDMLTGDISNKPITPANTAARQGLVGTEKELGVQAERASNKLWSDVIAPKLDAVKGKVNVKAFLGEVEKEIEKTVTGPRKTALREAMQVFKEQYKNVSSISLKTLQDYKKGWAKFLPESSYSGRPIASAIKEIQDVAAGKARQVIYKNIGSEGKQAYIDWGNLQSIMESAVKSVGDPASKSISRNVWQFVMDKAITPVATLGGKVLYRTGEGLELVGQKGAKKVKDIVGSDLPKFSDDLGVSLKDSIQEFKNTPNKQGGFAKIGSEIPKKVSPEKVAKMIDETDTVLIDNYLKNPNIENYSSVEPIIKGMKIEGLTEEEQKRFLIEVMDEYGKKPIFK